MQASLFCKFGAHYFDACKNWTKQNCDSQNAERPRLGLAIDNFAWKRVLNSTNNPDMFRNN